MSIVLCQIIHVTESNLTAVTQAAVRLALSKAEAEEIEHGVHISLDDDISPSVLISSGMELEDQQCVFTHHVLCLWLTCF